MYELLGLPTPEITSKPKPKTAPKLVIDRTGENDQARYSGLKLGQILDDDLQAETLAKVQEKAKQGQALRPKLQEELYVAPFADKRNVGPKQTPSWTPEQLDEWGKQQGKAQAWARKAKQGAFVRDPAETLDLEPSQKMYSILTALLTAAVFGKSTQPAVTSMLSLNSDTTQQLLGVQEALQAPALALLLAAVGSGIFSSMQAGGLNRNQVVWLIKGVLGGPLTVRQVMGLDRLTTVGEQEEQQNKAQQPY